MQPYLGWANGLDEKAQRRAETLKDPLSVYLVPEVTMLAELGSWVLKHSDGTFEQELWAWCRDATAWPQDRYYPTFRAWFSVDTRDVVIDLGGEPIQTEVL